MVTSILECQAYFLETFLYSYNFVWDFRPFLDIPLVNIPYTNIPGPQSSLNLNLNAPLLVKQCTSAATLTVNVGPL